MSFTTQQLSSIVPTLHEPKLSAYTTAINDTMLKYGILTPIEQAMFIGQIMHESAGCFYTKELASGTAYEGRKDLGNIEKGDGVKFKGRGLIQITGRANYTLMSKDFGVDFITHPELLETPQWATESAGWFWKRNNVDKYADLNDFDGVSDLINRGHKTAAIGDSNGYADRLAYFNRAKKALGI